MFWRDSTIVVAAVKLNSGKSTNVGQQHMPQPADGYTGYTPTTQATCAAEKRESHIIISSSTSWNFNR